MTKLFVIVFGTLVACASLAHAEDFAVGGGKVVSVIGERHFSFSAHQTRNGLVGHVVLTQISPIAGDFELKGHVSCLTVYGNSATIGVAIEKATGTAEGKEGMILWVTDNGSPGNSLAPDRFANSASLDAPPLDCPFLQGVDPVVAGNIEVNDDPSSP